MVRRTDFIKCGIHDEDLQEKRRTVQGLRSSGYELKIATLPGPLEQNSGSRSSTTVQTSRKDRDSFAGSFHDRRIIGQSIGLVLRDMSSSTGFVAG